MRCWPPNNLLSQNCYCWWSQICCTCLVQYSWFQNRISSSYTTFVVSIFYIDSISSGRAGRDCVNRQIEAIGFEKADNNRWTFSSPFTTVDKSEAWTNNGHRNVLHIDFNLQFSAHLFVKIFRLTARCLKITGKVSFKIAREARATFTFWVDKS